MAVDPTSRSGLSVSRPGSHPGYMHLSETAMHVPPPSVTHQQSTSHVLRDVFRELYSNDEAQEVPIDPVQRFELDPFVARIKMIQNDREAAFARTKKVEEYLESERARLRKQDEKDLSSTAHCLGIPSLKPALLIVNSNILVENGLIAPSAFLKPPPKPVSMPQALGAAGYMGPTQTSNNRKSVIAKRRKTFVREQRKTLVYSSTPTPFDHEDDAGGSEGGGWQDDDEGLLVNVGFERDNEGHGASVLSDTLPYNELLETRWPDNSSESTQYTARSLLASSSARTVEVNAKTKRTKRQANGKGKGATGQQLDPQEQHRQQKQRPQSASANLRPKYHFQAEPTAVIFSNYQVGQVLTAVVKLVNISGASQSIRLLPLASPAFATSNVKFGPNLAECNTGRVAAGMSCEIQVSFIANTLADYEGQLMLILESGEAIKVPLIARRPPPALGLPAIMNTGSCAIEQDCEVKFECENSGAPGVFRFMRKKDAAQIQSVADIKDDFWDAADDDLTFGAFTVFPAVFSLEEGDQVTVSVKFAGKTVGVAAEALALVVNNGTVHNFEVKGSCEAPEVRLVGLYGNFKRIDRKVDKEYLAVFEEVYPGIPITRSLKVANECSMDLPFRWKSAPTSENDTSPQFTVSPAEGVLYANGQAEFKLTFAADFPGTTQALSELKLTGVLPGEICFGLTMVGTCKPFDVALEPAFLPVAGKLDLGRSHSREVYVKNASDAAINFSLSPVTTAVATIDFSPSEGMVAASVNFLKPTPQLSKLTATTCLSGRPLRSAISPLSLVKMAKN